MPLLDAVWDPIAGKVVYRDLKTIVTTTSSPTTTTTAAAASSSSMENLENHSTNDQNLNDTITKDHLSKPLKVPTKNRRRSRSSKVTDTSKVLSLDWRTTDETVPLHHLECERTRHDTIASISPSKFHQSDKKDPLPPCQLEATIQILRKEQTYERRAFKEITCYKSFPLQEQAVRFCESLQSEWDLSYRFGIESSENNPLSSSASMASTNSSSTSTSSVTPEPKRQIRAAHMSPTECTMIQQYRNQFIHTRSIPSKSLLPTIITTPSQQLPVGTALYCLEPRIFAIESKKSKPQLASYDSVKTDVDHKNGHINIGGGRRRYVVAHVGRFMDTYWCKTEPEWRHAYELIPPHTPCRLYLDIECVDHPDLIQGEVLTPSSVSEKQDRLLTELYKELAIELQEQYGNEIFHCPTTSRSYKLRPLQRHDIVDLDSSTATKFSRHWIVHVPVVCVVADEGQAKASSMDFMSEALFPDNAAVGTFVRQWVGRMAEQHATGQLGKGNEINALQKYLFVHKKSKNIGSNDPPATTTSTDQMSCLIDLGVYTKNRLFRLMGSMKYGKPITAAFRIADTNRFPFTNGFGNECFYVPAMDQCKDGSRFSDTRNQPSSCATSSSAIQQSLSKTDWSTHSDAMAQTFVIPINVAKIDYPMLPRIPIVVDNNAPSRCYKLVSSQQPRLVGNIISSAQTLEKSPYPMIDEYVQNHLAHRGGTFGLIRAWSMEVEPVTFKPISISYQMCQNRYCERIGRAHKSNNIIWNCNITTMECYQTCYDTDCRAMNFRGQSIPLPTDVYDELRDALFEEDLARLDISDPPTNQHATYHHHQQQQPTTIDVCHDDNADEYDDESSFDEALAALHIDEFMTGSSKLDLPTTPVERNDT